MGLMKYAIMSCWLQLRLIKASAIRPSRSGVVQSNQKSTLGLFSPDAAELFMASLLSWLVRFIGLDLRD